jgi:hypothetical protein
LGHEISGGSLGDWHTCRAIKPRKFLAAGHYQPLADSVAPHFFMGATPEPSGLLQSRQKTQKNHLSRSLFCAFLQVKAASNDSTHKRQRLEAFGGAPALRKTLIT